MSEYETYYGRGPLPEEARSVADANKMYLESNVEQFLAAERDARRRAQVFPEPTLDQRREQVHLLRQRGLLSPVLNPLTES